jgi:hypothetical protein
MLLPALKPFPAGRYGTDSGRWAPGTACAMTPANHPAATAKTGVRMATNLPISEASVGAEDGTTDGAAEGGELFMTLLGREGAMTKGREGTQLWRH